MLTIRLVFIELGAGRDGHGGQTLISNQDSKNELSFIL